MLRRTIVALGLAVLLSLLFPVRAVLEQGGVDPLQLRLPGIDLAALCAVVALLPAMALSRLGQLDRRMPRWNLWLALLALFSIVFVLLHVSWSLELASGYLHELLAQATLPLHVSERGLLRGAEFAARVGVLVSVTGVLVNLQATPDEDAAPPRRRARP
jgi:hypothetical protein